MKKTDEAKYILKQMGFGPRQYNPICCRTFLSLCGVNEFNSWKDATNEPKRIHDIIVYLQDNFEIRYAENTRETIRKQALHYFKDAAIVTPISTSTNDPNYRYKITDEVLNLVRSYGSITWEDNIASFTKSHPDIIQKYEKIARIKNMEVDINGRSYTLSRGKHNELQILIMTKFAPKFAPDSKCLYLGDTIDRDLIYNKEKMESLGFSISVHDKMPDIVLYSEKKDRLYFIEAVNSGGAMTPQRVKNIEKMTSLVKAEKKYVSAVWNFRDFKKYSKEIAWETDVWIAEIPEHMIHFNGDKFL